MKIIDNFVGVENIGLHDSRISKIEIINNCICFSFSQGFWKTNEQGKLIKQLQNCKMTYHFVNENPELWITDLSKRKNISFTNFQKIVNKYGLDINQEFRCVFSKHIILECGRYLIETDDIKEIVYEYGEIDDWRIKDNEDYLNNLTLYKVKFPDFWEKSYALKNKFYQMIKADGESWVNSGHGGGEFLDGEKIQHFWHEHCALCWEKALTNKNGIFYCTEDFKYWICEECFNDFQKRFHWNIKLMEELLKNGSI